MIIKLNETKETTNSKDILTNIKDIKKLIKGSDMSKDSIKSCVNSLDEILKILQSSNKKTKTESVRLRENYDAIYAVRSYYDGDYRGLEDKIVTEDWSEVEDFAHEKLMNGNFVKITNVMTGNFLKCDPDCYQENFDGEFIWSPTDVEINDTPYYKGTYMESVDNSLDMAKKLICDYCEREYGDCNEDFSDLSNISILYTTDGDDDEVQLQAYVDLDNYEIRYYRDDILCYKESYDSLEDMIENALKDLNWDDLYHCFFINGFTESVDNSLDNKVIGATKLVREMYDKFPDVDFIRERNFNNDEIMLMFSIKGLDKDRISEVENYLKSVGADYAIGFDRMKVFASKD